MNKMSNRVWSTYFHQCYM